MKALVLEDDPALRFALSQVLEEIGYTVWSAGDIRTAYEILDRVSVDLLLLDLMIGKRTSIQVADLAEYSVPNADVVYLTGSNRFPNGELFNLSKNASWVLRKPMDFGELQAMLKHLQSSGRNSNVGSAQKEMVGTC